MTYQTLKGYEGNLYGSPEYSGMEYDKEVPDSTIIGSPGGSSTTFHHYTKGLYGVGNSSSDNFGGMGYRYPYGEFGNMYQIGQNSPHQMGYFSTPPDIMYTPNSSTFNPQFSDPYYQAPITDASQIGIGMDSFKARDIKNSVKPKKNENTENFEILPQPDKEIENFTSLSELPEDKDPNRGLITHKIVLPNPFILFVIFVVAYIAMDFWAMGGQSFIQTHFHGGKLLSWKWFMFYAFIFTTLMIMLATLVGVPLITLEQL